MKKLFIAVLIFVCALMLTCCGEPPYKSPASYYDERVAEDVASACGRLEDAQIDLRGLSRYLAQAAEAGDISQAALEEIEGYLSGVEIGIEDSLKYLGW